MKKKISPILKLKEYKFTNNLEKAYLTSLVGSVNLVYSEIVSKFGEPITGDEYKISGEWIFEGSSGSVFTLYDWKSTNLYDPGLPSVEEFRSCKFKQQFNIGGNDLAREEFSDFLEWLSSK